MQELQSLLTATDVDLIKPYYCINLDVDGVLHDEFENLISAYQINRVVVNQLGGRPSHRDTCEDCIICMKAKVILLDRRAVKNFEILANKIAKKVNLHIIISSTWREGFTTSELREIFSVCAFSQYIAGRTVDIGSPFSEWKDYCILPHIELSEENYSQYIQITEQNDQFEKEINKLLDTHGECRASQIKKLEEKGPNYVGHLVIDDIDNHMSENFGADFISTNHGNKCILNREDTKKAYARYLQHLEGHQISINSEEQNLDVEFAEADAEFAEVEAKEKEAQLLQLQNEPFHRSAMPWATF